MRVLLMAAIMFLAVDTTQFDCYFCGVAWHELQAMWTPAQSSSEPQASR
jgi:hypothetical protein